MYWDISLGNCCRSPFTVMCGLLYIDSFPSLFSPVEKEKVFEYCDYFWALFISKSEVCLLDWYFACFVKYTYLVLIHSFPCSWSFQKTSLSMRNSPFCAQSLNWKSPVLLPSLNAVRSSTNVVLLKGLKVCSLKVWSQNSYWFLVLASEHALGYYHVYIFYEYYYLSACMREGYGTCPVCVCVCVCVCVSAHFFLFCLLALLSVK